MHSQSNIELLTRLGLTINQAKIYIACTQYSSSTVNQISKATKIASEVVYRTIPKLQRVGLVEKIIKMPVEFQATPIDVGVSILLEQRIKETAELQAKTIELLRNIKSRQKKEEPKDHKIVFMSGEKRLGKFAQEQLLATQLSWDAITTVNKFSLWMRVFPPLYKKLLAKNVKIRLVIAGSERETYDKKLEELRKNDNFKIKFIPEQIPACVGIIDDKDTLINPSPKVSFSKASFYWSNDPAIIALCTTYFEKYWNQNTK